MRKNEMFTMGRKAETIYTTRKKNQAMNKAKISMTGTLLGMILRTICLFIFCHIKIGLWGLIIATSINIIFVTIFDFYNVKKILNKNISYTFRNA